MKSIIITGGAGFIGSHVVRLFVNKYPEYRIINVDKLTYAGNLANLKDIEDKPNYRFVRADICDFDTIFDRVREYNGLYPKREKNVNINDALNNTLSRTFSTSMSTFVVLLAIFIFGGETIQGFVFALLMGVIVGTYSSLFIASPIAYDIQRAMAKRAEKKAAAKK